MLIYLAQAQEHTIFHQQPQPSMPHLKATSIKCLFLTRFERFIFSFRFAVSVSWMNGW